MPGRGGMMGTHWKGVPGGGGGASRTVGAQDGLDFLAAGSTSQRRVKHRSTAGFTIFPFIVGSGTKI